MSGWPRAVPGEQRSVLRRGHRSPYSVTWNTTTLANGTYTLTARARDAAGNTTTTPTVTVTVANAADTGAPTVASPRRRRDRLGHRHYHRHRHRQCRGGRRAVFGERRSVGRPGQTAPYSATVDTTTARQRHLHPDRTRPRRRRQHHHLNAGHRHCRQLSQTPLSCRASARR